MTQFTEPSKKKHTDHNDTSASRLFMASNKLSTDINFTDIKNSCKFPTLEKKFKNSLFQIWSEGSEVIQEPSIQFISLTIGSGQAC